MKTNRKGRRRITLVIIIIALILGWGGLTKAGYLPNFLNIGFLYPEDSSSLKHKISPIQNDTPEEVDYKPVIYLYPEKETKINVKLNYKGRLTVCYPEYLDGWSVSAFPDGKIINNVDHKEYSYLFWEGEDETANYDLSTGFIVERSEMVQFLQEKLFYIGLIPKEYNELIVYWLPLLQKNKYTLVHFASKKEYADRVELDITPKPNSMLRVYVVFQGLDNPDIELRPQELNPFTREGFTVVEWGGTLLPKPQSL